MMSKIKVLDEKHSDCWSLYNGDCCEVTKGIPDNSVGYSIFSPPFAQLYVYSDNERDMGNSKDYNEFFKHFEFLVKELKRVIQKGRLVSVHCIDIPAMKERDGYIGLKDFPGDIIRLFEKFGFIYHGRHVIWKDPLIEATRTKAIGLMHQALCKDSAISRSGLPDYLLTFRHPEQNENPIKHKEGLIRYFGSDEPTQTGIEYSHNVWRRYASPVWMDIRQTRTLNIRMARSEKDERHVCPLQLDTIARGIELYSNEGDVVFSPYAGIGSELYQAVLMGRKAIGIELKDTYYEAAIKNITVAEEHKNECEFLIDAGHENYIINVDDKVKNIHTNKEMVSLDDLF